jgi:mandelate racemase
MCCTPTAHWLEYADWWNPVMAQPIRVDNGLAMIDGALGSGVSWNEPAVDQYCI